MYIIINLMTCSLKTMEGDLKTWWNILHLNKKCSTFSISWESHKWKLLSCPLLVLLLNTRKQIHPLSKRDMVQHCFLFFLKYFALVQVQVFSSLLIHIYTCIYKTFRSMLYMSGLYIFTIHQEFAKLSSNLSITCRL